MEKRRNSREGAPALSCLHRLVCAGDGSAYFAAASKLFRAVRFPDMKALAAEPQTAGSIRRAFAARNKGVTAAMVAVSTNRDGWLDEVRLCLGPRMRPRACKPFQVGAPDGKPVRITPMPGS